MNTMALFDCVVVEFEALTLQRDKLLAVNKVLVEALALLVSDVRNREDKGGMQRSLVALKLAGEIGMGL